MKIRIITLMSIVVFSFLPLSCQKSYSAKPAPRAINGVLDLSDWDFEQDGVVQLDGEWEFYWEQLLEPEAFLSDNKPVPTGIIRVPNTWESTPVNFQQYPSYGYATLRLVVKSASSGRIHALKIKALQAAHRIWVNQEVLSTVGRVGNSKSSEVAAFSPGVKFFISRNNTEIIIQLSNFIFSTGTFDSLAMGTDATILRHHQTLVLKDALLTGALIVMGLYHLILFWLRKQDRSTLYLSGICFIVVLETLSLNEYLIQDWFNLSMAAWYTSANLIMSAGTVFFLLFVGFLYPNEMPKKLLYVFIFFCGIFFLLQILTTVPEFSKYFFLPLSIFDVFAIGLMSYAIILAIIRKREGARLFASGFAFMVFTGIWDLGTANFGISGIRLMNFGLLAFIFFQSTLLARMFSRAFSTIETQKTALTQTNRAYRRFVPAQFLKYLRKDNIIDVQLGDQVQMEMTILFADIRSFTALSESMSPKENFDFLNSYLARIAPVIRANNGFIDKYIGDAIMALFPGSPNEALDASIAMQTEMQAYNEHRVDRGFKPIKIGIALHTGLLMLGTIGDTERMEGTVISDAVNLASRLEGLTKRYNASIVVSGDTYKSLKNPLEYQSRFLDLVKVKGKTESVFVMEILDGSDDENTDLKLQTRADFDRAVNLYQNQKFELAVGLFHRILESNPNDKAADLYVQRCHKYNTGGILRTWDGAEEL